MRTDTVSAFACPTTISVPEALLFGAPDGACVSLGFGTVIAGVAAFAIVVLVLQVLFGRLLSGSPEPATAPFSDGPVLSARKTDDG